MNNEIELIKKFLANRSEENFLSIYRYFNPQVYAFAESYTRDNLETTELIQEMWMVAIRKIADFEFRSSFKTWLIGILINLGREMNRKRLKSQLITTSVQSNFSNEPKEDVHFAQKMDIDAGVNTLSKGYRQVLVLHDIEGYTHKEISRLLGITEGTSKSQLHHARNAMRKFLTKNYLN